MPRQLSQLAPLVFGELLDEMLHLLTTTDLIECRTINDHWCHTASRHLLKRSDNQITFRFCPANSTFILERKTSTKTIENTASLHTASPPEPPPPENEPKKLSQLTTLLYSSSPPSLPQLPCSNFRFRNGGSLGEKDCQAFLDLHGLSIKSLTLDLKCKSDWPNETKVAILSKMLTSQLPNLNCLEFTNFPTFLWSDRSGDVYEPFSAAARKERVKMVNLKILKIGEGSWKSRICMALLGDILRAAVNLKILILNKLSVPMTDVASFSPSTVGSLANYSVQVKNADVHLFTAPIEWLEKFAAQVSAAAGLENQAQTMSGNGQLERLSIHLAQPSIENSLTPSGRARVVEAFGKILQNSATSLNRITIGHSAFVFLNQLILLNGPIVLPKVTKFRLRRPLPFTVNVEQPLLVPNWFFRVAEMFPKLTNVKIDLSQNVKSITKYFPRDEPVPSVTELTLNLFHRTCSFPHSLHKTFPRVQTLKLCHIKNFLKVASHVWKFREVVYLKVGLHIGVFEGQENCWPCLDMAFTGFSGDTVLYLMEEENVVTEAWRLAMGTEPPSICRENWSIRNMRKLRNLKIVFYDETNYLRSSYDLFSAVTAIHALNQVPELCQVKLCTENGSVRYPENIPVLERALSPLTSLGRAVTWHPGNREQGFDS